MQNIIRSKSFGKFVFIVRKKKVRLHKYFEPTVPGLRLDELNAMLKPELFKNL